MKKILMVVIVIAAAAVLGSSIARAAYESKMPAWEVVASGEYELPPGSLDVCIIDAPRGYTNLRTGPGLDYERVALLENGEAVEITSFPGPGSWHSVYCPDGDYSGWIELDECGTLVLK